MVTTNGILISAYNPTWPRVYLRERRRILAALPGQRVAIEHIGSTSVPGLAARPIIDIMAGIARLEDAAGCITPLEASGYTYHPEITARLELHDVRLFARWSRGRQTVHLHLVEYCGSFWREKLLFRDFLRSHPDTARTYESLKRELAPRFTEGPQYSPAKTEFIQSVLQRAQRGED